MRTATFQFDLDLYKSLYKALPKTLDLNEFLKLPSGAILFSFSDFKLYKFGGFSDLKPGITLDANAYELTTAYGNINQIGRKATATGTFPDTFLISIFNTASTFKVIKKGTLISLHINTRAAYFVLDHKIVRCLFPFYTSIEYLIKANKQYSELVEKNPKLENFVLDCDTK